MTISPRILIALLVGGPIAGFTPVASTPIPAIDSQPSPERFTVRPQDIATNARTTQAGVFSLDSVPNAWLYVPTQCVGTRCPLLVYLHGSGLNGRNSIARLHSTADRFGLLVLGTTAAGTWWNGHEGADMPGNQRNVEVALREIGRRVAVDGRRIALVGECNGGFPAHHWGFHNLDIFSRIGTISGELWDDSTIVVSQLIPRTTATQFFVQESIVGGEDAVRAYRRVQELRANGNTVMYVASAHGHGGDAANFLFLGRWLVESWGKHPGIVARALPPLVVTADLVTRATDATKKLMQDHLSLRDAGRTRDGQVLTIPVSEQPVILSIDWDALVRNFPEASSVLHTSGLTAQDYSAVRLALVTALMAETLQAVRPDPASAASVLGQNMMFVKTHPQLIEALHAAGFFEWP